MPRATATEVDGAVQPAITGTRPWTASTTVYTARAYSDWVSAADAVEFGLALQVCASGTVLDDTLALAHRIAAHPRAATRAITSLLRAAQREQVMAANRREQAAFAQLLGGAAQTGTLAEFAAKAGD